MCVVCCECRADSGFRSASSTSVTSRGRRCSRVVYLEEYIPNFKVFDHISVKRTYFTVALVLPISTTSRQANWLTAAKLETTIIVSGRDGWQSIKRYPVQPCYATDGGHPLPFYLRDAMLARVMAIATCLSVCPSVTRRYCVKTKKASGMISSPSDSPNTLVF